MGVYIHSLLISWEVHPKIFFVIIFYLLQVATYNSPSAKQFKTLGTPPK
jgi:hypothetical protein